MNLLEMVVIILLTVSIVMWVIHEPAKAADTGMSILREAWNLLMMIGKMTAQAAASINEEMAKDAARVNQTR